MINTLRELSGGALIMLPSSVEDIWNPELAAIAESIQVSADGRSAENRITLMKLVWDAVGSEFAGRHTQYEMFYAGAQFVTRSHSFRIYDWDKAEELIATITDRCDLNSKEAPLSPASGILNKQHKFESSFPPSRE